METNRNTNNEKKRGAICQRHLGAVDYAEILAGECACGGDSGASGYGGSFFSFLIPGVV